MRADRNVRSTAEVIHIAELPAGWLGKTHAMWTAAQQATGDWLLFTDADVLFKPDSLRRAVAYAETEKADHVVLFPRMIMKRPGERMMIAFFQTHVCFWASALEGGRSRCQRSHGRGRVQHGAAAGL